MPIYSYQCEQCQKVEDVFRKMVDRLNAPLCECGGKTKQIITSNYYVIGDIQPYVDDNITSTPTVIKSKQHRKQLMKEHGVYEKYGKGWI